MQDLKELVKQISNPHSTSIDKDNGLKNQFSKIELGVSLVLSDKKAAHTIQEMQHHDPLGALFIEEAIVKNIYKNAIGNKLLFANSDFIFKMKPGLWSFVSGYIVIGRAGDFDVDSRFLTHERAHVVIGHLKREVDDSFGIVLNGREYSVSAVVTVGTFRHKKL
jgi:hypothetical protein